MSLAQPSLPGAKALSKVSIISINSLLLASAVAVILSTTGSVSFAETATGSTSEAKAGSSSTATSVKPGLPVTSEKPNSAVASDKPGESNEKSSVPGEPPVLDPNKFFGHAKSGYAAAKLCPEVCAKLFCYCGCDMTDDHDSLLDCFTTDHGVDCHICQEEALIALKMKREGKTIKQIQQAIDIMFEKEYPFDEPSAVIQKYRKNRLWQPGTVKTLGLQNSKSAGKTGNKSTANTAANSAAKSGATNTKAAVRIPGAPILGRDGKPAGACCAGHSKGKN